MSDFDLGLPHHNYDKRGLSLNWNGSDSQELFQKNCANPAQKEKLEYFGWLDPDCISYKFNSFGFRDEEFDSRLCGLAVGCSHTQGVGLPESAAWPRVLSNLSGTYIWNLGVGGSSIDTAFRLLDRWLPILMPKFVVLCIPPESRVEVFDYHHPATLLSNYQPTHLAPFYKVWASSDANAIISIRKNLLAIQQLCDQNNIPLRYLDHTHFKSDSHARDLMHYGVESHNEFAKQMYTLL
jgi:hypothetical protein